MQLSSSNAGGFDWSGYIGYPVYSADNQPLGVFAYLSRDDRSGESTIIITARTDDRPLYRIPVGLIGVITPTRLMIDLVSDRIDRFRLGGDSPYSM